MTTIWDKLYDKELVGPVEHRFGKFEINTGDPLPKKSPDNPQRGAASVPMLRGTTVVITGALSHFGYEQTVPATTDKLIIRWTSPDNPGEVIHSRMNFATREFETTNAAHALVSFSMMGIGAAIKYGIPAFKDTWAAFLANGHRVTTDAITLEVVGEISDIAYGALRYGAGPWPKKLTPGSEPVNDWKISVVPVSTLRDLKMTNIRNSLANLDDFDTLMEVHQDTAVTGKRARFQGEQLEQVQRFLERHKHVALLGPPGVGKSLCSFEVLRLLGFERKGIDYQLFTCHEEVKSSDLIGAWQPNGKGTFDWVDGPLVRAMTANGGKGQPMLVEEFTRMPTKSQNIFISVLSDGYLVRNEKPGADGVGELVLAGEEFVLLTDMNVDPAVDDIDLYGAAFARRVRKIEFSYPKVDMLQRILRSETGCSSQVASAAGKVYDHVMKLHLAHDVAHPINPGSMVQWMEDYLSMMEDGLTERVSAQQSAKHTWLRDVAGTEEKLRNSLLNEIEAAFRVLELKTHSATGKPSGRTGGGKN